MDVKVSKEGEINSNDPLNLTNIPNDLRIPKIEIGK